MRRASPRREKAGSTIRTGRSPGVLAGTLAGAAAAAAGVVAGVAAVAGVTCQAVNGRIVLALTCLLVNRPVPPAVTLWVLGVLQAGAYTRPLFSST